MGQSQFIRSFVISVMLVQRAFASSVSHSINPRDDISNYSYASAASINPSHPSTASMWAAPPSYPSGTDLNDSNAAWTNGTYNALDWVPKDYSRVRVAHAVLACVAFLILFPLGGIIPRLGIRPMGQLVQLHIGMQMFAFAVFAAAAGMGIWMAQHIQELDAYHPVIGMIILGLLAIQPLTETLNAIFYRPDRHNKIIILGHIHIWLGRILLTAGIVNGGLGFLFGGSLPWNSRPLAPRIIYGIAALTVWVTYMLVAVVWPHLKTNGFKLEDLKLRGRHRIMHPKSDINRNSGIKHGSLPTINSYNLQEGERQREASAV